MLLRSNPSLHTPLSKRLTMKTPLLPLLASALLCMACTHTHQLPAELFFEADPFTPDSLTGVYPLPAFTVYTKADTTGFEALQDRFTALSSWDAPIEAIACSPTTGEPLFASFLTPRYRVHHFLDKETEALFERIMGCLPDHQIRILASDQERRNLLVEASDDRTPPMWYNYDCDSMRVTLLHAPSQTQLRRYLSPVVPVTFTARDGATLHGYLTLPHGIQADESPRLHAIVMPHAFGGAADRWEYNAEVQFLANRGLAVLQVEYRDASDDNSVTPDDAQRLAVHDVRDGADWLVRTGIASHSKVFYHVHDDLPYASADRMFRDPGEGKAIDKRHHIAFYNDMARKATR